MQTKFGAVVAIAGLALALGISASRAAIVETIIETDDATTLGSITFPTLTGDGKAGVLFSYGAFTQADITSISWTLDPANDAVIALDLDALQGDNPCPNGGDCSNSTLSLSPTQALSGGASCHISGDIGECAESFGQADITFVPLAVPEPSAWAMAVIGFVGLGLAGRRSKRQLPRNAGVGL
jgi:hypothetical protein